MFCHNCGNKALDGAAFCQKCGAKLIVDRTAQQSDMSAAGGKALDLQSEAPAVDEEVMTNQLDVTPTYAGTNKASAAKDIVLHCKACGAALENDCNTCKACGRVFASSPGRDTAAEGMSFTDLLVSLYDQFKGMPITGRVLTGMGALFAVGLIIVIFVVLLRLIFSSLVLLIVVVAGGYFVYYRWGAEYITKHRYNKRMRELRLPDGMSPQTLLEALSGKFNYPYFKGVRYGENGECVIDGQHSSYTITIYDNDTATLSANLIVEDKLMAMLEGIAICSYINKFFNPSSPLDVVKDIKALKSVKKQRKTVGLVITVAFILIFAVSILEYALPGSLQRITKPGVEVRGSYLTEYSETVTIEEAFDNFFDNGKWSTYESEGYSYVAFTGACEYLGERADVRLTFKITGELFGVDNLDVNGQAQSDIMMYALLSKVYEEY